MSESEFGEMNSMSVDAKDEKNTTTRRDFIVLAASSTAAIGAACALWPMADSLNPSAEVLALSSIEVDLSQMQPGQSMTVKWRGKPIFIKHRTPEEIAEARKVNLSELRDPEKDEQRVKAGHEQWLVMIGICTHLGCVPMGGQGEYDGWFCPCHGSDYDSAGRIRKGPAPKNLEVPNYEFLSDTKIKIG
jgi:ubiquinol-cytochrome c reductase iron-sulfur subunit